MTPHPLQRMPICRNDWLPAAPARLFVACVPLVLALKGCAYVLAFDKAAILASRDWLYHAFWLPLHLLLARCASGNFARHVQAAEAGLRPALRDEFARRVEAVTSPRGLLGAMLLVAPFAFLDARAGADFVDGHFDSQGYAAALIPLIWMIEWAATALVWLYVLGSIYITPLASHQENLRDRHLDVLVHGRGRESIQAGLENALVVLIYGLSTIGYVWFADGQLSDYLVLGVSTVLVLACFFTALVRLKSGLRQSLDEAEAPWLAGLGANEAPAAAGAPGVPFQFLADSTDALYGRRFTGQRAVDARIRLLKLAACLPLTGKEDMVDRASAARLRMLIECEVRWAELGVGEMRGVAWRAGMPILAIAAKSLGGLIGR